MPTQIVNFGTPTTGPAGTEQCQEVRVYVNRAQAQDDVRLKVSSGSVCNVVPAPATVVGATLAGGCYTEDTPGAGFTLGFGTASDYSFEAQDGATFAFADALSAPAFEDYWWDVDSWAGEEASSRTKGDAQASFVRTTISSGQMVNATANQGVVSAVGATQIAVAHQQRTPGQTPDDVTVTVDAPATITETDPARGIWSVCRDSAVGGTFTHNLTATNAVDASSAATTGSFTFTGAPPATSVETSPATGVQQTQAILNGIAHSVPAGRTMRFALGTASGVYGQQVPAAAGAGTDPQAVSQNTGSGLTPNTTYFYRLEALNAAGDATEWVGDEESFTTQAGAALECNDAQSGPFGRHWINVRTEDSSAPANGYSGDGFHTDVSTAGPAGPWTPASTTDDPSNDCVGDPSGDSFTGGSVAGLATTTNLVDLTPGTDYWVRTQHTFSASGDPLSDEVVCGPYSTPDLPVAECGTPGSITQTTAQITRGFLTPGQEYDTLQTCAVDTVTVEYGTVAGGPYPLSSAVTPTSGVASPPHDLTGLTANTTYFYRTVITNPIDGTVSTSAECSFATLAEPNVGPTITGLDDQAGTVNTPLSDQFQVADSDGTVVSVASAPAGATLVDNGGGNWTISYTPTAIGSTTFTVTVTDDDGATVSDDITFTGEAVTNPFQPLPCDDDPAVDPNDPAALQRDVEGTLLCDIDGDGEVVGTALVEGVYDENGARVGTRTVDPVTGAAYTPTGTLQPCTGPAGVDVETIVLCDTQPNGAVVPFQVVTVYDGETGDFISERRVGAGGVPYTITGNVGNCQSPTVGWEAVCYTTTATGDDVLPGTKRHDDRFPPPGFQVFDSSGQRVDNAPGYAQTNCDQCCAVPFGEGCWSNTTGSGTWTTLREADGTIIGPLDTLTGDPVDPGDIGDCPAATITVAPVNVRSHALSLAAGQSWTPANLAGETALSVGFTVVDGTANIIDSDATPTNALPAGFSMQWAVTEDANTLFPPQSVAAVGGRVIVAWTSRA